MDKSAGIYFAGLTIYDKVMLGNDLNKNQTFFQQEMNKKKRQDIVKMLTLAVENDTKKS